MCYYGKKMRRKIALYPGHRQAALSWSLPFLQEENLFSINSKVKSCTKKVVATLCVGDHSRVAPAETA